MILQYFPVDDTALINKSDRNQIEFQRITIFILTPNGDRQKYAPYCIIFFIAGQPFLIYRAHKLMGIGPEPPAAVFYLNPKLPVIGQVLETILGKIIIIEVIIKGIRTIMLGLNPVSYTHLTLPTICSV